MTPANWFRNGSLFAGISQIPTIGHEHCLHILQITYQVFKIGYMVYVSDVILVITDKSNFKNNTETKLVIRN